MAICGGIHLAYGLYNINLGLQSWMVGFSIPAIAMISIVFHIFAFIGGTIGSFVYVKIEIFKIHVRFEYLILLFFDY